MRLFLNANTLISGIIFKGKEHDLLLKSDKVTFITSEDVIDETMKTIKRKFPESIELVDAFLKILNPEIVKRKEYIDKLEEHTTIRDEKDRHVLAAAIVDKSNYIVSGDADLLILETYQNMKIVKAKKMLSLI